MSGYFLCTTEVSHFTDVLLGDEDVLSFEIPVQNAFFVQVLDTKTNVNPKFPCCIFHHWGTVLLLYQVVKIAFVAILLDDVDSGTFEERVVIADNEIIRA